MHNERGPFRNRKLWVYNRKCDTCIYRPGNLMDLRDGARDKLARDAVEANSVIICHEHQDDGRQSICRGFYDVHRSHTMPLRLATAQDMTAFDDPPGSNR